MLINGLIFTILLWQAAKRHLTQRIENLDGKMDDQRELSKEIKNEVSAFVDLFAQLNCWICMRSSILGTILFWQSSLFRFWIVILDNV